MNDYLSLATFFIFLISTITLLLSITIHEFAHAWVADQLGDPTPRLQGRVTLNPLAHLDPVGTVALLLVHIGWGKPVQFDPHNFRHPLRDTALVALAGPATNILIAVIFAGLLRLPALQGSLFLAIAIQVILTNMILAIFNLIPVHPLDGSKILLALLPRNLAIEYETIMEKFGFFILLALILPWGPNGAPISALLGPVSAFFAQLLIPLQLLGL
jgi:Zn-dependent protease